MRMNKINILRLLATSMGINHPDLKDVNVGLTLRKSKGQIRGVKSKPSGAATFKRASLKRKNILKNG